jgi:hypothetical protein
MVAVAKQFWLAARGDPDNEEVSISVLLPPNTTSSPQCSAFFVYRSMYIILHSCLPRKHFFHIVLDDAADIRD